MLNNDDAASAAGILDNRDRICDQFRQLEERWNNRLVLEGLSLAEAYGEGRLAIALVMGVRPATYGGGPSSRKNDECTWTERARSVAFVYTVDVKRSDGSEWDQRSMLVHTVQLIEGREQTISPSGIRLYLIRQDLSYDGCVSLYKYILTGIHHRLPVIVHREISSGPISPVSIDHSTDHNIQSRPKVMRGVSDDSANFAAHRCPELECIFTRGTLIQVSESYIHVVPDESSLKRFQLLDVLVSPFNL